VTVLAAWATEGVVAVAVSSTSESMKAEAAAATRLVNELVIVSLLFNWFLP
jgi:hypothetical protein